MPSRDEEIRKVIADITGREPVEIEKKVSAKTFLRDILFVASDYDFFQVEEGGRLYKLFQEVFSPAGIGRFPDIHHVRTIEECTDQVSKGSIDLVIILNGVEDPLRIAKSVKKIESELPVIYVGGDIPELRELKKTGEFEGVFAWDGDGKFFVHIARFMSDIIKQRKNEQLPHQRYILLIEDSIPFYSNYISLIYQEIHLHEKEIMAEDITREQLETRFSRRPMVLFADDFDKGWEYYDAYKENILCVITDMHDDKGNDRAGLELARRVSEECPDIGVIIQSSEDTLKDKEPPDGVQFVVKGASSLIPAIKELLNESIGPMEIKFPSKDGSGPEIKVDNLRKLEETLVKIPTEKVMTKFSNILQWLRSRREYELAQIFDDIRNKHSKNPSEIHKHILDVLEDHRYTAYRCTISDYKREDFGAHVGLCRLGEGALGGKARGLAFISKLISTYLKDDILPDVSITVPRTMVLSTEVFDSFLEHNDLLNSEVLDMPDERLAAKFMKADLPVTVLGDLRSFVRQTRKPLIVRSSGVLEDALLQPFAGVYSSLLLPNESWETDLRFQDICNAIKYVFASTFFRDARNYLKSTTRQLGDEKMAVIIQEVIGKQHGNNYCPTISGVARSHNHYPTGCCPPEEGVVYLALGLGKSIVEGGRAYRFCPNHPKASPPGGIDDLLKNSQTSLYALNLETIYKMIDLNEEKTLSKLDLKTAEKHGELRCTASTFSLENSRLYPGTNYHGPRIIDFGPLLVHETVPLAKGILVMMKMTEMALGSPVEIEFAVNVDNRCRKAEIFVLQVRRLVSIHSDVDVQIEEYESEDILCYSDRSLGNGIKDGIRDIVYVRPDKFDISESPKVIREIRDINNKLMDKDVKYLLVGPGRWGSTDQWMGISVNWSDIAGSSAIVETPLSGRPIEPSQGSHFFHDMVSADVGYLLVDEHEAVDWKWLESLEVIEEKEHIKHVRAPSEIKVLLDGKKGKGIVLK